MIDKKETHPGEGGLYRFRRDESIPDPTPKVHHLGIHEDIVHMDIPASVRFLAAAMANFGPGEHRARNSHLATLTGLPERTVEKAFSRLVSMGHVERHGPTRYRRWSVKGLPPQWRKDPRGRWIPAEILSVSETSEFKLWLSLMWAHRDASAIPGEPDMKTGFMQSAKKTAERLNLTPRAVEKYLRRAKEQRIIVPALGDNLNGGRDGWKLAEDYLDRIFQSEQMGAMVRIDGGNGPNKWGADSEQMGTLSEIDQRLIREPKKTDFQPGASGEDGEPEAPPFSATPLRIQPPSEIQLERDTREPHRIMAELDTDGIPVEVY